MLYLGGNQVMAGTMLYGDLSSFINYIMQILMSVMMVAMSLLQISRSIACGRRILEVLDTDPDIQDAPGAARAELPQARGGVEFRDVSFRYPGTENWALRHLSVKFEIGKKLAVVGPNGSGKTTFIKLLCRLYDPTEGEILLNGIDIRKYNYREYMDVFSVVFQDFQLLAFSLGQNVAAAPEYDRARAEKALAQAGFGDRLKALPLGTETSLFRDFDENGVEVSGGEGQKIAIARALYKDAPFLILDEPTAALDPIAEAEIYEKLNDMVGDKTAIYISHRLSSCKFCDEIVVFDAGKIIQQGAHETLLADESGEYAQLWNAQAQYYR